MEKITELLDKLKDLEKLIPKMDKLVEIAHWLISISVRIGPLCLLFLGVIYLLIPPKEANRRFGYRTYFGMGSIEAWLFTQRAAGIIMTLSGLILHRIAKSASKKFVGMATMAMAEKAFEIIRTQIIWILVIYAFMFLLTAVLFNRKGLSRFRKKAPKSPKAPKERKNLGDLLPKKKAAEAEEALPEAEYVEALPEDMEYERQGEQVITADDIVIEGLDE